MCEGSTRSPCTWKTLPCSKPAPILCTLTRQTSAPAFIAQVGRSGWKGRCAPHASSTISGLPRLWQTVAMPSMSAQVPYGLGLTTMPAAASGYRSHAASNASGDGGCDRCRSPSQRGCTHRGRRPEKTRPATTDLCASRPSSRSPSAPATASMAAFTDSELPQVEKNACSAPTASAISSSAVSRTLPEEARSSRPELASTSLRKGSMPRTSSVRGSAPRPCRWPGGVKPYRSSRW